MAGKTGLRRLFIAIDLSDAARAACVAHIDSLRREFPSARVGWERPEKLHITLKFLGPTSEETLSNLNDGIGPIVRGLGAGRLRLAHPGVFPNRNRARILWIGADDPDEFAARAYAAIEEICHPLGFESDDRRFTPHITLGRVRDPNTARGAIEAHLEAHVEPVEFEAKGLVLYESKLLPTGSIYSVVARFPD